MNEVLRENEVSGYQDASADLPILHVVGAPRSGTTLLMQLLAAHLDIGYINNLSARFWGAPVTGILLSNAVLGNLRPEPSFSSSFGQTTGITEPHEFGRFWRDLFGVRSMRETEVMEAAIDWSWAGKVLAAMSHAFNKPLILKSFVAVWRMEELKLAVPMTMAARVRRNPVDVALSLSKMRRGKSHGGDKWVSIRPKGCEDVEHLPLVQQVAKQVTEFERTLDDKMLALGDDAIELNYEDICAQPATVVATIQSHVARRGAKPAQLNWPPSPLEIRRYPASAEREAMVQAFAEIISGTYNATPDG